jgi:hypothetical protein
MNNNVTFYIGITSLLIVLFLQLSCSIQENWEQEWNNHHKDFKQIVDLVKADKLKVVYGRAGYAIPDSFDLHTTCGQIVFRETDFTYDNSHSILFRLHLDTNSLARIYHTIVYTDNKKRIKEYEADEVNVFTIEKNWYFLKRL